MYIWSPKGYANAFLMGAGPPTPISPAVYALLTDPDRPEGPVPTVLQDDHLPTLLSVCSQSGLRLSDLTKL